MAKNKLSDLNDHLFAAIERLNDEDLTSEQLEIETKRADSIVQLSNQVISIAKTTVDALKLVSTGNLTANELPKTFDLPELNKQN